MQLLINELSIILNEYLYENNCINFQIYNEALKNLGVDSW